MKQLENDYLCEIGPALKDLGYECGIVAGGSYSYKHNLYSSLSEVRDIDLLLILESNEKISDILTVDQHNIDKILHLDETERHFSRQDIEPFTLGYADGIRYSGINQLGQKISIKILSYKTLENLYTNKEWGRLNILSKKDKRIFPKKTLQGEPTLIAIVNQRVGNDFCILGDPDFIAGYSSFCLGVVSDLFISGLILHQTPDINIDSLKQKFIQKIYQKCQQTGFPERWSKILSRYERMPEDFKRLFESQFPAIINYEESASTNHNKFFLHIVSPIIEGRYPQLNLSKKINSTIKEKRYMQSSGPFSSNSNYGVAIFESGEKTFFKEMLNQFRFRGEMYGLITASAYYRKLKEPIYSEPENNLISYDWFPGDILSRKRLTEVDDTTLEKILTLELQRAEDHLNAYIRSAVDLKSKDFYENSYRSRIHDVFFGRLTSDRYHKYYDNLELELPNDDKISFKEFARLKLIINDIEYPCIAETIKYATEILDPKRLESKEMVCGLGDSHSGNIMCSHNLDDYQYIDYELSGFHSPYLDISKQIYYDTSYEIIYSDKLIQKDFDLSIKREEGKIIIKHNFLPSLISCYMFKIKLNGVLLPYRSFCQENSLKADNDWKIILGMSLFCNGLLTRDPVSFNTKYLWLNICNAIQASMIDSFSKNYYSQII